MNNFRFASSDAFHFLWLIPVFYFGVRYWMKRSGSALAAKIGAKIYPFLSSSVSQSNRVLKLRLQALFLALLVMAYARPQSSDGTEQVKNEGIEIMILFDVSNSMLSEDIKPNRLSLAKKELSRFLDMSSGDRMGLIAFAGSAVLLSPMSTDKEAIRMFVEALTPDSVQNQGTNIASALKEAQDAFSRGGLGEQSGVAVTRSVLLISDGEDFEQGAIDEAERMKDQGIHLFSLAVGTEQGGPIPIRDAQGIERGYKRDKGGQVVMSQTKGSVLKELARIGEGTFHHLTFEQDVIRSVRGDIEKLQKTLFESGQLQTFKELFQWFLWLALIVGLIELWLGDRQAAGRIWKGRFEVAGN